MDDDEFQLPEAVPAFAAHFTDPLYDDPGDELAPFGSDEGADLLWTWGERRDELGPDSTLATVLECDPSEVRDFAGPMEGIDGLDQSAFLYGAAFVLLRLVGHLADEDRALALEAIDHQLAVLPRVNPDLVDPAQLVTARADLVSWRNPV